MIPELNKQYTFRGKTVRYIGWGKHTAQHMFRDIYSGNIIFFNEAEWAVEEYFREESKIKHPFTRVEIIYAD